MKYIVTSASGMFTFRTRLTHVPESGKVKLFGRIRMANEVRQFALPFGLPLIIPSATISLATDNKNNTHPSHTTTHRFALASGLQR
jgi:hypothetical protein